MSGCGIDTGPIFGQSRHAGYRIIRLERMSPVNLELMFQACPAKDGSQYDYP